jgi:quercetin dioxygenase-like cupin family protein
MSLAQHVALLDQLGEELVDGPLGVPDHGGAGRKCRATAVLRRSGAMSRGKPPAQWSKLGEGEQLWFLGTLATIRIPGEAVGGRFALIEFLFPQGASPPLHTHPQDESYVILEGSLTIQAANQRIELSPGGAAVVPMGIAHTFRVDSDTAQVLVLSTPAGLERMVRDGSVPADAPTLPPPNAQRPSPEELEGIFRRHGQINVGPPMSPARGEP